MPETARRRGLSRETRLLIVTITVASTVLLLLARLRFPEPPAAVDTTARPLERLAARASFEELATRVARLEDSIAPNLIVLRLTSRSEPAPLRISDLQARLDGAQAEIRHVAALRTTTTTAFAAIPPHARISGIVGPIAPAETAGIVAMDPVRHVARVRVPEGRVPGFRPLPLSALQTPTYVVAVEGTHAGLTFRPVFLGRSDRFGSPRWTRPLLPLGGITVTEGALMFTLDGEFLGCVVVEEGTLAIAGAMDVLEAVDGGREMPAVPADPGISVQTLTEPVARATGAGSGVVVADVFEDGAAEGVLEPADVITAIDGEQVADPQTLLLRLGTRLAAGAVRVTIVRQRQSRDVQMNARKDVLPPEPATATPVLQFVRGSGSRIRSVAGRSPFEAAGVRPGDIIVRVGGTDAPDPSQVRRAIADTAAGEWLLIVVRRGEEQRVLAVNLRPGPDGATR